MRKNLLSRLTAPGESAPTLPDARPASGRDARPASGRQEYVDRGASRSMRVAIEDIAETSRRMTSGEVVVEIEPDLIEPSPIRDRLEEAGGGEDAALRDSIAHYGQRVPILIRPKAGERGRYVTVYGHRRVAAARALGKSVRAVIAHLSDEDAYVAQGQENNDRRDTSFIEKALFASRLRASGLDRARVADAVGVADTIVSKMTAIVDRLPAALIVAIGPAPSVGRPKWEAMAALVEATPEAWAGTIADAAFRSLGSDDRFGAVLGALQAPTGAAVGGFAPVSDDAGERFAFIRRAPNEVTIRIPSGRKDGRVGGRSFAEWVEARLAQLHEEWRGGV